MERANVISEINFVIVKCTISWVVPVIACLPQSKTVEVCHVTFEFSRVCFRRQHLVHGDTIVYAVSILFDGAGRFGSRELWDCVSEDLNRERNANLATEHSEVDSLNDGINDLITHRARPVNNHYH